MEVGMGSNLKLLQKMSFLSERRRLELYPPFWLMRVKVLHLDDGWRRLRLLLPLNWLSANAAGNMYGGYQASLADPIPALACLKRFPGYRVATRKLEIDFIRVGNSHLTLHFDFSNEQHDGIQQQLEDSGRASPRFEMHYLRADGMLCTRIQNTVAIRPKGYIGPLEKQSHED